MRYEPLIPMVIGGVILGLIGLLLLLAILVITWEKWVKNGGDEVNDLRGLVYWGIIVSIIVASTGFLGTWIHG